MIVYDVSYFNDVKNKINVSLIDKNVENKINNILSSHNCFQEKTSNKYNSNSKYRYRSNKFKYKKNDDLEKNNVIRKKNRTDDQILLSYLNKLTHTNYDDLSIKIIENICEENYIKIMNKLFEISYKQTSYCELYILLYKKIIISITEQSLIDNIINHITTQINDIINNKNNELSLIDKHIDKVKLDYDDFCDINKNAKHLKGKIFIISNLIKNEIIKLEKNELINNLFKYENYDNEIFLELLQILNNILKLDDNKISVLQEYVNTANFKGKMMLKFKLKDIIDNKLIKAF